MDIAGDALAGRVPARTERERTGVEMRHVDGTGRGDAVRGEQSRQFAVHRVADGVALMRIESVQHQLLDVQLDRALHTHPPVSASVSCRSSFVYSLRAARRR